MLRPADALTLVRLAAAAAMPAALVRGDGLAAALWVLAAVTDFADGPAARRWGGPSRHGAVLDPLADVAFVLAVFVPLALGGRVPWVVPLAIAASVAAYVVATVRLSRGAPSIRLARSRIGHAAGVVNYGTAGVAVAALTWPDSAADTVLPLALGAVVLVNLGAIVDRSLRGELSRRTA